MLDLSKLEGTDFTIEGNSVVYAYVRIAVIEESKLRLLYAPLTNGAYADKATELADLIGLKNTYYVHKEKDFKRTTTVSCSNKILEQCKRKYGNIANALKFAAEND